VSKTGCDIRIGINEVPQNIDNKAKGKIGLTQILPTSRDVNSHTAAILREKSVTLAYFVGYGTLNKKRSPGIAIQTRPPAFPGSRF